MSEKRIGSSRKRMAKVLQEGEWDCSVCTFTNSPEAFKCLMCDVRKGTSTRKPKLNQHIVAQQEATRLVGQMPHSPTSLSPPKEDRAEIKVKTTPEPKSKAKLKDFDRSNPVPYDVTVNDVTFTFIEYRQKDLIENEKRGKYKRKHDIDQEKEKDL